MPIKDPRYTLLVKSMITHVLNRKKTVKCHVYRHYRVFRALSIVCRADDANPIAANNFDSFQHPALLKRQEV